MQNHIKKFITNLGSNPNFRILWIELLVFSVILGSFPHLWPIACLIFLGLSWELNQTKSMIHMVYILSSGWALMIMLIAYSLSGWGWAVALGVFIFMCSVGIHFRDLRKPLFDKTAQGNNTNAIDSAWPKNRWNLN